MTTAVELLRQGRRDEFWQRYCGFMDLGIEEFMAIQDRLLVEQLHLLAGSELGRAIMGRQVPLTPGEFRRVVPITSYKDYVPYLTERREDVLPVKPVCWMRTSGRTGEYHGKWVPVSPQFYRQIGRTFVTNLVLAGAKQKGDITLQPGARLLYVAAPPPYVTGTTMRAGEEEFPVRFMPSTAEAEKLSFEERVQKGFAESMGTGLDYFAGVASILIRMGDAFTEGSRQMQFSTAMLKPAMISRLSSAFLTSKMEGRELLPKDIWRPKGIIASGMDVGVYRPRIRELWGRDPLEVYACTEFGGIAIQPWGSHRLGLTFFPDSAYWEFLTESDYAAWRADSAYRPKTLLLNELQPGRYVLVGTSFNGGAFIRYVVGDLIKVVALSDEQAGIRLPQIVMESRADDIINLGSMIVLTERSLWEAMRCGKLTAMDWIARKEYDPKNRQPFIHLYVECDQIDCAQWTKTLHESLIATHEEYTSYSDIMRVNPWTVSSLAPGTFQGYLEEMTAEGADPGHLKPPRMQPPDHTVGRLLAINDRLSGKGSKG